VTEYPDYLHKARADNPDGFSGLVALDPLPDIPEDAAQAGMDALVLALAAGPRLADDPYAVAKGTNFDRLLFCKMPLLCDGPTGLHTILTPGEMGGLIILGGVDE
jgi:hypothetical protein